MARATTNYTIIKKVVEVKEATGFNLYLSPEEASVLRVVCSKIGGHPNTTHRGKIDAIAEALEEAGVQVDVEMRNNCIEFDKGTIYFK